MVPTNSLTVFLRYNDSEFHQMLNHICIKLNYKGSFEDLVQDFYTHLITMNILPKYNRHFTTGKKYKTCKISSYLYPIMKNFVIGIMKSSEYKYSINAIPNIDPKTQEYTDFDTLINCNIARCYQETLDSNNSTDSCDGPGADLKFFYESFKDTKKDKRISRKRCQGNGLPEASLSQLFVLLYEGYSNKEIAEKFGVSSMYITYMKQQLADRMIQYGFSPMKGKKNDSCKMPKVFVEC